MKIKLDENLPVALASLLAGLGHDAHTTQEEGLSGKSDDWVWGAAQAESRFLITQDMDFSDPRRIIPGSHHGLLLVRLRSPSRKLLLDRVINLFETEDVSQWEGCFVVASGHKVRVQRPPRGPQGSSSTAL